MSDICGKRLCALKSPGLSYWPCKRQCLNQVSKKSFVSFRGVSAQNDSHFLSCPVEQVSKILPNQVAGLSSPSKWQHYANKSAISLNYGEVLRSFSVVRTDILYVGFKTRSTSYQLIRTIDFLRLCVRQQKDIWVALHWHILRSEKGGTNGCYKDSPSLWMARIFTRHWGTRQR